MTMMFWTNQNYYAKKIKQKIIMFSAEFKASIKNGGKSLDIDLVDDHTGGQGRSGKKMYLRRF